MMLRSFSLVTGVLSFFCSLQLFGQNNIPVSGTVVDPTGVSLPFAAVFFEVQGDMKEATTTDDKGRFVLQLVQGDEGILNVQFLSFETLTIPLRVNKSTAQLGKLTMKEDEQQLQEIVLESEKSLMTLNLDKREYNVSKDINNRGGNASSVLNNIPSVEVDVEGTVQLRGSGNVRILIDGKPSSLLGINSSNALDLIPAETIERVEVITNPSARYDAGGEVGIINIVLKKQKMKGFNGVVNANVGWPESYGLGYDVNYRKGRWNVFSGINFNKRTSEGFGQFTHTRNAVDTSFSFQTNSTDDRSSTGLTVRLGTDFTVDERNSITFSGLYNRGKGDDWNRRTILDRNIEGDIVRSTERSLNDLEDQSGLDLNASYKHTGRKEGNSWSIDAQFNRKFEDENGTILQTENEGNTQRNLEQRAINDETSSNGFYQFNATNMLREGEELSYGARLTTQEIAVNYTVQEQENVGWRTLPFFTNQLRYSERVYAGYGMYSRKNILTGTTKRTLGYQAGLRVEHTDVLSEFLLTKERTPRSYTNAFPSLHVTYTIDENNSWQVSGSRRVRRPNSWLLMPFFSYASERNFFQGNPELNPSFTTVYEVVNMRYWDKWSLVTGLYHRYTTDEIDRITLSAGEDPNLPALETVVIPHNIGTHRSYGVEVSGSYTPSKSLKVRSTFNYYRSRIIGEFQDANNVLDLSTTFFAWNLNTNIQLLVAKGWNLQTTLVYRSRTEDTQGSVDPRYFWNAGFTKDFWNNKATLSFTVNDILNSRKRIATSRGNDFQMDYEFQWIARNARLAFSYRINRQKPKERERSTRAAQQNSEIL